MRLLFTFRLPDARNRAHDHDHVYVHVQVDAVRTFTA
jgi:hypothetical protein